MPGQVPVVSFVARNLRIAQAAAQVSNIELAEAVGVAPRTVGKWRRAEVDITLGSLERVACALDRDVAWFLSENTQETAA